MVQPFGGNTAFIPQVPGVPNPFLPAQTLSDKQQQKFEKLKGLKKAGGLSAKQQKKFQKLKGLKKQGKQLSQGAFDITTPGGAFAGSLAGAGLTAGLGQLFNRPDQFTSFGSRQFQIDPETGALSVVDALSEPSQTTLEGLQGLAAGGLLGQAQQALGQGLDTSGLGDLPQKEDFGAQRAQIEQDLFNRFNELNEPVFEQQKEQLQTSLSQRGIPVGSELFNKQVAELEDTQNQARERARQEATTFAAQEQDRLFQSALQSRQQGLGEALQARSLPLQELGGLLSLQAGIPQTNFGPIANIGIPNVDIAGLGLGFAGLQQDASQFAQSLAQSGSQFQPKPDPFALAQFQSDLAKEQALFNAGLQQPIPQGPSSFDQLGAGLGGALGIGLGSGLAGLFG